MNEPTVSAGATPGGSPDGAAAADVASSLLGPVQIRQLAQRLDIRPTKTLGQNFVHDPNTIRRIVRAAELAPDESVLEVGPGLGSLTMGILSMSGHLTAVEIDARLAAELPRTVREVAPSLAGRLAVVNADALTVTELPEPLPTALVANLPYNVAVPVLLNLMARFPSIRHGVVMVQLEVADRLAAAPGSKVYGAPSAKLAFYGPAKRVGVVPRNVFWPVPNVESGLVRFTRVSAPDRPDVKREQVFAVIDAAFSQRRKMLRSALAGWAGSPADAERILLAAGVPPTARGETVDIEGFVRIAAARED